MNKYNKLASTMLELASDEFSNHGCNDLDDKIFSEWSEAEKQEFIELLREWGSGVEINNVSRIPDWMVMSVLAYKLGKQEHSLNTAEGLE